MEIGMIGLGRMGGNMVQRLLNGGHRVVTYDRSAEAVTASQGQGAVGEDAKQGVGGEVARTLQHRDQGGDRDTDHHDAGHYGEFEQEPEGDAQQR